jgi:hypothetical protein
MVVTGNASTVASLVSSFLAVAANSTLESSWLLPGDTLQPAEYSDGQSVLASPTLKLGAMALC